MPRNRKIFYIVFAIFLAIVILVAIDMGSRTNPPWKKRKETLKKYEIDHFKKKI
ncbi:MAG TPA: hypothetical protein VNB90_04965 [Cytophagaceae bacterium]|jgi:hypothetical protein|nr:hypothetical protein [Cytophagaceae bacterium]